jgi:DNA-binding NarL/FixJ family response regulator
MTDGDPIRVVLADDHPVVRAGLAALLTSLPGIDVVGVASTGREAVREVITSRPHVAVLDLQMPDLDGFAATRELARSAPDTAVLVLTMFEDDDSVFAAMRAGARGYLVKGAEQEEIARAIRAVAAGEAIFGPGVARRVLTFFSAPPPAAEPFPELTARERQILDLIAAGLSNPAIADRATAIIQARNAGLGTTEER